MKTKSIKTFLNEFKEFIALFSFIAAFALFFYFASLALSTKSERAQNKCETCK